MSLFARLDAAADRVQVAVMGDPWTHRPMREAANVNAASEVDPDRPVRVVKAIFSDAPAPMTVPDAYDQRSDKRPGLISGSPMLDIDPRQIAGEPLVVRRGDLFESTSGRLMRVTAAPPDAMGRILCNLNEL